MCICERKRENMNITFLPEWPYRKVNLLHPFCFGTFVVYEEGFIQASLLYLRFHLSLLSFQLNVSSTPFYCVILNPLVLFYVFLIILSPLSFFCPPPRPPLFLASLPRFNQPATDLGLFFVQDPLI